MPDYLQPATYIEDLPAHAPAIEGVPTSFAALLGETERGALAPRLVTSLAEYERAYGGQFPVGRYLPDAVRGFFENGGRRAVICRIASELATTASADIGSWRVEAAGPGEWGNRLFVRLSSLPLADGLRLQIAYLPQHPAEDDFDPFASDAPPAAAWLVEDFRLSAASTSASVLVRPSDLPATPDGSPLPTHTIRLSGGSDGAALARRDFEGKFAGQEATGLAALGAADYDDVALIAAPGATQTDVQDALRRHCEQGRIRFAVLDGPDRLDIARCDPRSVLETSYAGYYVPWLSVASGVAGQAKLVPPSGHVLGIIARTDVERGVWKAPANESVRGIQGLERLITKSEQDILNPRSVNVIRLFEGRGIRLWGARTLSNDSERKHVSVRRFLMFVEHSLDEGIRWAVFERNAEPLWARVRGAILLFLSDLWRQGALLGGREQEAYFVRCDATTMTAQDLLDGRLVCVIGLAVVRPAEFVIIRIALKTAGESMAPLP